MPPPPPRRAIKPTLLTITFMIFEYNSKCHTTIHSCCGEAICLYNSPPFGIIIIIIIIINEVQLT